MSLLSVSLHLVLTGIKRNKYNKELYEMKDKKGLSFSIWNKKGRWNFCDFSVKSAITLQFFTSSTEWHIFFCLIDSCLQSTSLKFCFDVFTIINIKAMNGTNYGRGKNLVKTYSKLVQLERRSLLNLMDVYVLTAQLWECKLISMKY